MSKYKAYPSYKDSGVEWLGEIPEGWSLYYGKRLFENRRESSFVNDSQLAVTQKYGVLPQKDFMKKEGQKVVLALKGTSNFRHVEENDFVISLRSFQGGIEYSVHSGCVSPAYTVLKSIKSIDYKFYMRLFKSTPYIKALQSSTDSLREGKSITYEQFGLIQIPRPPLQEQQTIANYLDTATAKIDTLIAKQTKLIELLVEKRQAVISTAVTRGLDSTVAMKESGVAWLGEIPEGWRNYRIDWVSTIIRGNTGFKKDELLDNGEFIALQYGKTYKVDEINEAFNFYVNSEFYKSGQVVHYGDTILISTSETVEDLGHSCFYGRNDLGLIGGEQILLKPNKKLLFEKYLYYYSKVFCKDLRKYSTGLKVFRFSIDDLKNIFIVIPSLEEQEKIANHIDQKTQTIDTLITKATQAIALLKERRTALISAVVTGKVKVNGEAREDALGQDVRENV